MKSTNMKIPALQQLYNQKYQYQKHKKKLIKIYQSRKSQLSFSHRNKDIDYLKQSKIKSFIHKFNQQSSTIAKQNLILLDKLQKARTSILKLSLSHQKQKDTHRNTSTFITPLVKKKIFQTQKQNLRIVNKMKNLSSTLNQKNFMKDYVKSQQIKNRLLKYGIEKSKVYLKSDLYLSQHQHSNFHSLKKPPYSSQSSSPSLHHPPKYHKTTISQYYNRQDIIKHKIDSSIKHLHINISNKKSNSIVDPQNNNVHHQDDQFFTTQPFKQKK